MSITHIRPYQLLLIPDDFEEEMKFFMPSPIATGSLTVFESVMLVKLLRCVDPKTIFEFGTYKGATTRLMLENLSGKPTPPKRLYTLDLPALDNITFQGTDRNLAEESLTTPRKYLSSPRSALVEQILQDSMTLNPAELPTTFDFIFIDANHELTYVRNDTENALKMLSPAPSCIVWHDYGNPQFPELTAYLEDLSTTHEIHHIEDTMLAFHLRGKQVAPRR